MLFSTDSMAQKMDAENCHLQWVVLREQIGVVSLNSRLRGLEVSGLPCYANPQTRTFSPGTFTRGKCSKDQPVRLWLLNLAFRVQAQTQIVPDKYHSLIQLYGFLSLYRTVEHLLGETCGNLNATCDGLMLFAMMP